MIPAGPPLGTARAVGVIPCRFASTRLPGKPLADLGGHPLMWHVWDRARRARSMTRILIATDDPRIESAARAFGAEVILTSPRHPSGTDRVAEAVRLLGVDADLVANIQGDEPFLDPELLDEVVACAALPGVEIATAATPLAREEYDRASATKVVMDGAGRALYFSRAPIPWTREGWRSGIHWKHVGLYVYRRGALERFVGLPPSALEACESLEPLRAIEAGMMIRVVKAAHGSPAVDTAEDLERVRRLLAEGAD